MINSSFYNQKLNQESTDWQKTTWGGKKQWEIKNKTNNTTLTIKTQSLVDRLFHSAHVEEFIFSKLSESEMQRFKELTLAGHDSKHIIMVITKLVNQRLNKDLSNYIRANDDYHVKLLVDQGIKISDLINIKNPKDKELINYAYNHSKNIFSHLIDNNLLHDEVINQNASAVKHLLKFGISANPINKIGNTPLHYAAQNGEIKIVELLIEKGARVDISNHEGLTALHYAAENGEIKIVKLLIEKGAKVNASDKDSSMPLHYAAAKGHTSVVQLLIEKEPDVNISNNYGTTALHRAAFYGHEKIIRLLIEKGAHVNVCKKNGDTSLHFATSEGHIEIVKILIKNGADIYKFNNNGWTPFSFLNRKERKQIRPLINSVKNHEDFSDKLNFRFQISLYNVFSPTLFKNQEFAGYLPNRAIRTLNKTFQYTLKKITEQLGTSQSILAKKIQLDGENPSKFLDVLDKTKKILNHTFLSSPIEIQKQIEKQNFSAFLMDLEEEHTVGLGIFKEEDQFYLIRCNKGGGATPATSGIKINRFLHQEKIPEVLDKLLAKSNKQFFLHEIEKFLELEEEVHIPQKMQKIGNCPIASFRSLERAILFVLLKPVAGKEHALEMSKTITRLHRQEHRYLKLQKYLNKPFFKSPSVNLALITAIYNKKYNDSKEKEKICFLIDEWEQKNTV